MNLTYNDQALILGRSVCNEHDKRVLVYTFDHGLIEATAVGAARTMSKLGQHLEPFREISVMIALGRRSGGYKIAQAVTRAAFQKNSDALACVARTVKKFCVRGAADPMVYGLVRTAWERITAAEAADDIDRELGAVLYALLQHWGVAPARTDVEHLQQVVRDGW